MGVWNDWGGYGIAFFQALNFQISEPEIRQKSLFPRNFNLGCRKWGVTNGGLRGVWPPFPEIGRNRPFSPFFCLFRPFPGGAKSAWEIQKTEEKGLFPQISSDFLKPPSLKPPFAALQSMIFLEISPRKIFRTLENGHSMHHQSIPLFEQETAKQGA